MNFGPPARAGLRPAPLVLLAHIGALLTRAFSDQTADMIRADAGDPNWQLRDNEPVIVEWFRLAGRTDRTDVIGRGVANHAGRRRPARPLLPSLRGRD